jgi:hypothetical protein
MNLPNFLIIGAAKAGSTSLHYILDQHPDIFMCPMKEPSFFWAVGKEIRLIGPGSEVMKHRYVDNITDYQKLFIDVNQQKAVGESSVRYLADPEVPKKIFEYAPNIKLIAILRQPAERAFSSFVHYRRDGMEPCEHFYDAIAEELDGKRDTWMFGRYLKEGLYFQALTRYLKFFDRSQILILFMDDFQQDLPNFLETIYGFLGVDQTFHADISHRHNPSGIIRNPLLRSVWTNSNRIRSWIRPFISERFRHYSFEFFIRNKVEKPIFNMNEKRNLTEYYRRDIENLQDLVQRDLSEWLLPLKP